MLKVDKVNFHHITNSQDHKTNKYEVVQDSEPVPVLRRGQSFRLSISFDRPYKHLTDVVRVYFKCVDVEEKSPRNMASIANSTITRASQILADKDTWSLGFVSADGNHLHIKMKSPSNLPFATYKLYIDTKTKTRPGIQKYQYHQNVYFLFNPWCKGDDVYMPDTKLLDEYILTDVGKIYINSSKRPKGIEWVFGQFAKPILPALLLALKEFKDYKRRGNPVYLSRELTKVLCSSNKDNPKGVLQSLWDSSYDNKNCSAIDPLLWDNSITIFDNFLNADGKPVKFGRCWVLSAITTTACRAIGIPCRPVTGYNIANDADFSMSVDKYILVEGTESPDEDEKIWEFHVWNDVWMSRYDLPQGYGGWQAIDSSPRSSDIQGDFMCGPASLVAVKNGEINHNYDTNIITSQINADVVTFACTEEEDEWGDKETQALCIDTNEVGKVILTKKPYILDPNGDNDFQDITSQYKENEGTKEERLAFFNALRKSDNYKESAYSYENLSFVEFKLQPIENVDIGDDITALLEIKNESLSERKVQIHMALSTLYYNGNKGNHIKSFSEKIVLSSNQNEIIKMKVKAEEYGPKLVELAFVKLYAIGRVLEENYIWAHEDHFNVNLPEIAISSIGILEKGKDGFVAFTIRNPLKARLTGCRYIYQAPGIGKNQTVYCNDIMSEEEVTTKHKVTPSKSGDFFISVLFESKQLKCITGRASIRVI